MVLVACFIGYSVEYIRNPLDRLFVFRGFLVSRTLLAVVNLCLCLFLLVSSALGLAVLKRAGVSSENKVGLKKMLAVAVVFFVTTLFGTTNMLMQWPGLLHLSDWYWYGLDKIAGYVIMMSAILYFVFSALHAKHVSLKAPRESESEMSQKLLPFDAETEREDGSAIPKTYVV